MYKIFVLALGAPLNLPFTEILILFIFEKFLFKNFFNVFFKKFKKNLCFFKRFK